jgi:oxygen-independent coproporphyrinogen-3 oxidase
LFFLKVSLSDNNIIIFLSQKMKKKRPESIYIHIPFCIQKCNYCSFVSFSNKLCEQGKYVEALIKEISSSSFEGSIKTIYIGGGTPSLIDISNYKKLFDFIFDKFHISKNAEITIEANPATGDLKYFSGLKEIGINRLSIGAQSFDDKILKLLNRPHSSQDIKNTVSIAQKAGFENISLDIIYGLPSQTIENMEKDLYECINLGVKHISTYGLKIEDGTIFAKKVPKNLPDEDLCADMYLRTIDILSQNNFKHYEISNFAQNSFESKHNINYWKNNSYYAFGLAAHGYVDDKRFANTENFDDYLKNPFSKEFSKELSPQEILEEGIFLGLRLTDGLNLKEFKACYNIDILTKYKNIIEKYDELDMLKIQDGKLALTTKGLMLSNSIMADFIE